MALDEFLPSILAKDAPTRINAHADLVDFIKARDPTYPLACSTKCVKALKVWVGSPNYKVGHITALCIFLCGVAPIRLEIGRYDGLAEENRICLQCTSKEIENEKHVILNCAL